MFRLLKCCGPSALDGPIIRGLDPSIIIPPIRFHLTLGVMALETEQNPDPALSDPPPLPDSEHKEAAPPNVPSTSTKQPIESNVVSSDERSGRTVDTALWLLRSLKPQIDEILFENSNTSTHPSETKSDVDFVSLAQVPPTPVTTQLEVALDTLDIMRPVKPPKLKATTPPSILSSNAGSTPSPTLSSSISTAPASPLTEEPEIWADILYLAPQETPVLRQIADLVNKTFKKAGYITETRPLKLHCTVLNTSKRRPSRNRGQPFSYSDLLHSNTLQQLLPQSPTMPPTTTTSSPSPSTARTPTVPDSTNLSPVSRAVPSNPNHPAPIQVSLGKAAAVRVQGVELWIMGSRARNGAYVSCGGVPFGTVPNS
ncbi:hypothetical protein DXG01_016828 [Tephrocybe rancida]|nr:hypothetical protein DXG01_016828 [Tephrocybe rancida]